MSLPLHYYERVSSTMDVMHELAAQGAKTGTAIVAGEQLEGRGSRGRHWHSPPGGLWLSVLFRPRTLAGLEVTSLRVGLAVAGSIDHLAEQPVKLKWPNDLMLGDRKLGGVLCEARWQGDALGWIAVGVGVNVNNPIPEELRSAACALPTDRAGITLDWVTQAVVASLRQLDLGAGSLSVPELEEFARRDWLRGRKLRAPVQGTVSGLRDDGALLVCRSEGAEVPVRSGPVELAVVTHSR
jgi:BirA family transcriptional regulator, biotin operon repressor / biotin---[acetyl-CoA-carboxylase] ligase